MFLSCVGHWTCTHLWTLSPSLSILEYKTCMDFLCHTHIMHGLSCLMYCVLLFVIWDSWLKKADLCLNFYPCIIKYYLSTVKCKTCMDFLSLSLTHTHTPYSTTHHTQIVHAHNTHNFAHSYTQPYTTTTHTLTFPLILGSFDVSIFPTSHVIILDTGSKEYFPWLGVKVTFRTALGNGTSTTTFSTWCIKHFLEVIRHKALDTSKLQILLSALY